MSRLTRYSRHVRGERSLLVVCCCLLASVFAGCGGDSTSSSNTTSAARAATPAGARTTPALEAREQIERDFAPNPYREPTAPEAHPHARVERLIVRELKRGRGPAVEPGDGVYADYIEANYTTGEKFLRAWKHRTFGTENMLLQVPNWMRGLVVGMTGMRPGGRRIIIVPRRLSDVDDPDRVGHSYRQVVYWDVVLRSVEPRPE
jgi:FKBP-type peptidyl-prolyl cis-trans isomerase